MIIKKVKRGRPIKSKIRENIKEILYFMGQGHGYEVANVYNQIFPRVSQRVIYYHLKKGFEIGEFTIKKIKRESGSFSWGENVERIYYGLSPNSSPKISSRVYGFFKKYKKKYENK